MRTVVLLVISAASVASAVAGPSTASDAGKLALTANTLHSGIPGVRFGFGEEGEVSVDTETQEEGGAPYPVAMRKVVTGAAAADAKVAWYAAEVAATTGCDTIDPCTKAPNRFLTGSVLLEQAGARWRPIAWHVAEPVSSKEQAAALAGGATLEAVPPRIDKGAEPIAKRFREAISDPKALAASISSRAEVVMLGSSTGERWVGGPAVSAQLAKWKLAFTVQGGVQAGLSTSGKVAWVAANVGAAPVGKPKAKATPYRVTAFYELAGTEWRVVLLHFSFATNPYAGGA